MRHGKEERGMGMEMRSMEKLCSDTNRLGKARKRVA
jgi:hypothetical protein